MRIGLYGGTFDPPHNAHLKLADWVQKELYIYFIPTAIHALKNNSDLSPTFIRLKLVEAAIEGYEEFKASRIEIDRKDISYTIHTLQEFKKYEKLPESEMYYIIGIDNLADFHMWKEPDKIMELARIVVIRRSGTDDQKINSKYIQKVTFLESPIIDISATEIRNKINLGIDVSDLLPPSVLKVINDYGLYFPKEGDRV
jgi:nicotinate-nucleotide adenylyltransferase